MSVVSLNHHLEHVKRVKLNQNRKELAKLFTCRLCKDSNISRFTKPQISESGSVCVYCQCGCGDTFTTH